MKRLAVFCLLAALTTVQAAPAFAQSTASERFERTQACLAEEIPGQQELMTKLGGRTVMQNGRLVYFPPTLVQMNNPAYATPYDSGVAAAIVRHAVSCAPDIANTEPIATQLQAMRAFSNGLFTYGMLSMINGRFMQVSAEQLNASR